MSIEALSPTTNSSPTFHGRQQKCWLAMRLTPLWVCLLLALLARAWLVFHTHGVIDGDEATVGIQAQHILRGEIPIYYYGQPYMGSLEAYLMALLFAIAGSSVWTLRAEPTLLSLLLVWLTWKLAGALAEAAQLPASAQRRFMIIATLFAALPPLYDSIIELRTLGGYIETFVIILWLLLSVLRLTSRWQRGASPGELALRWAGIGFLIGLGFWVDPLVISGVLAVITWLAGYGMTTIVKLRQQAAPEARQSILCFALAITALPASLIGFAPALYWGTSHHWANITYITRNSDSLSIARLPTILRVMQLYQTCIAPRIIGGALPAVNRTAAFPRLFQVGLTVGLCSLLATALPFGLSFFWHHPLLLRIRRLVGLPLLFGACTACVFCLSHISTVGFFAPCSTIDLVGRYASPLLLALPFLLAAPFTITSMYLQEKGVKQFQSGDNIGKPPLLPSSQVVSRFLFSRAVPVVLFAVLLACYFVQSYTYAQTNAGYTFQTSGCIVAPANNDPLIDYLQYRHIHRAWASFWIGNPIIFQTGENIIVIDPRNVTLPRIFRSRIASYTPAVVHAKLPSVLTLIKQSDMHPLLLKDLLAEHIKYHATRFPSEPGVDLLVITPLNRNISPFTANSLGASFGGC